MLGYNVVFQIAAMLNFMPSVILTSKLCPPEMESTMFALLAGFQNFGSMVAGSLGVVLIHVLQIHTGADQLDPAAAAAAEAAATAAVAAAPSFAPPPPALADALTLLSGSHHHHHGLYAGAPPPMAAAGGADGAPGASCDFTRLPFAIVLSHMVLPLLSLPLAYLLLPDARLTDEIKLTDDGVHHLPKQRRARRQSASEPPLAAVANPPRAQPLRAVGAQPARQPRGGLVAQARAAEY
jgi:hypothetical protein